MPELKEIKISEVLNHLQNGVTKWKKEDLGFGSLEAIYNLTLTEANELFGHSKVKNAKTKIPTMKIIDDTSEGVIIPDAPVRETKIEVQPVVVAKTAPKQEKAIVPFM